MPKGAEQGAPEATEKSERVETVVELEKHAEKWEPSARGVITEVDDAILLNGTEVLYDGDYDDWYAHPDGVVIRRGHDFFLNGTDLIYHDTGKMKGYYGTDGHGVIIREGTDVFLNGKENLTRDRWRNWKRFEAHPKGAIFEYQDMLVLGGEILYQGKWDNWYPHPEGVLVEKGGKMLLNGEEELCPVTTETIWYPHPEGIVVRIGDKLCLNGDETKVWFDGNCDDVKWFGDLAYVKRNNTWLRVKAELAEEA